MEVSNSTEAVGYISSPNDFQKYGRPFEDDPIDDAKALLASLTYGRTRSSSIRGKITLPTDLLQTLINGREVGGEWGERVVYEDSASRYNAIAAGVTYGDAGDARVQSSIKTVLDVIAGGMENGRVVSRQAGDALQKMFESVRADIIAEHFAREYNAGLLFAVAKELDDRAHSMDAAQIQLLSVEAKSVLGVFADFVQAKRTVLLDGSPLGASGAGSAKSDAEGYVEGEGAKQGAEPNQEKLL